MADDPGDRKSVRERSGEGPPGGDCVASAEGSGYARGGLESDRKPRHLGETPAREAVGFLLAMAAHRFRDALERALVPRNLQVKHFGILATLHHLGPMPQQRLVDSVCIDRSTMVGLVDELEAAGLVERRPDPADRRAHRVHLTDRGSMAFAEAEGDARRIEDELLAVLDARERAELRRLLALVGDLDRSTGFEHINIRRMGRAD